MDCATQEVPSRVGLRSRPRRGLSEQPDWWPGVENWTFPTTRSGPLQPLNAIRREGIAPNRNEAPSSALESVPTGMKRLRERWNRSQLESDAFLVVRMAPNRSPARARPSGGKCQTIRKPRNPQTRHPRGEEALAVLRFLRILRFFPGARDRRMRKSGASAILAHCATTSDALAQQRWRMRHGMADVHAGSEAWMGHNHGP